MSVERGARPERGGAGAATPALLVVVLVSALLGGLAALGLSGLARESPGSGDAGAEALRVEMAGMRRAVEGLRSDLQVLRDLPIPARPEGASPGSGGSAHHEGVSTAPGLDAADLQGLTESLDGLVAALDRSALTAGGVARPVPRQDLVIQELLGDYRQGDNQTWFLDSWFGRTLAEVHATFGRPDSSQVKEDGSVSWNYYQSGRVAAYPYFIFVDGIVVRCGILVR